jgi:hypothetical protein
LEAWKSADPDLPQVVHAKAVLAGATLIDSARIHGTHADRDYGRSE